MILVISSEDDISTDYFMEWCSYKGLPVLRLNDAELHNIVKNIELSNGSLEINFHSCKGDFTLSSITAVWFRRGSLQHYSLIEKTPLSLSSNSSINAYLENESETLNDYLIYALSQKPNLNDPKQYNANKLIALSVAKDVGLNVPQTFIGKAREELRGIIKNGHKAITKPMQDSYFINLEEQKFQPLLQVIDSEIIDKIPEIYYYSKFQNKIEKKYELRIFYVGNMYFSAAIFSNVVEHSSDNKIVPFNLPNSIQKKLEEFNKRMNLNCGSIDMIVDKSDNYYFLEVNPVGQYDFVSKNCNYYLDKFIAEYFEKYI